MHDLWKNIHDHLPVITAVLQFFTTVAIGLIPAYVYVYTKRKDKLEFFYNNWNKQQDVNLECLGNDDLLRIVEELINGPQHNFDIKIARSFTFAFLHLNKIQNNFQAMRQGVLTRREYVEMSVPTLRLFARDKELITYLVCQRGYGEDFRDNILACLRDLKPYDLPTFSSPSDPSAPTAATPVISDRSGTTAAPGHPLGKHSILLLAAERMDWLSARLAPIVESRVFDLVSLSFVLNPVLLAAQLIRALHTPRTASLSPVMFAGFAFLNVVTALAGVKLRNTAMFVSFALSFLISMAILAVIVFAHP